MKYTKKFVLTPESSNNYNSDIDRDDNKSALQSRLDEFKNEFLKILLNKNSNSEENYRVYQELFTRFLNLNDDNKKITDIQQINDLPQNNQELPSVEKEENTTAEISTNKWIDSIPRALPKTLVKKGVLLAEHILNSNLIKVNNKGEISIDDTLIPGTNIIDLISNLTHKRLTSIKPKGITRLASALKRLNVPKYYIGNNRLLNTLNESNNKESDYDSDKSDDISSHKKSKLAKKLFQSSPISTRKTVGFDKIKTRSKTNSSTPKRNNSSFANHYTSWA
jgi:hypothetical protein